MKRGLQLIALTLALLGVASPWARAQGTSQRVVGGRVIDGSSGRAVVGAAIAIATTSLGSVTDSQGRFLVRGVPDIGSPIEVTIRHPCFHAVRVDVVDPGDVVVEMGLPYRPSGPEASRLGYCPGYGPGK